MPFAILVLMLKVMGKTDPAIVTATAIFFFARVAHALIYMAAIPYLRTVAFTISHLICLYLLWRVLV